MEGAIKTVVSTFLKSSKGKENLGEKDFQALVKNQMKNILTDTDSSEAIKNMRQGLDSNQDGKVSFQEYMTLVGYLAQALSQQQCSEKEPQASSSVQETQAEASVAVKAEAVAKVEEEPVKEDATSTEKDEAEQVEKEEEQAEDDVEIEKTS